MASLGNDLASIRIEKELSIEDVKQRTKIPVNILKSIENDSIFNKMDENDPYTRSYVRSYAKAIGIESNEIVRALNQAQKGTYKGGLLKDTNIERQTSLDYDPPKTDQKVEEKKTSDMVHDHAPLDSDSDTSKEQEPHQSTSPTSSTSSTPSVSNVDWVDMGRRFTPMQSKSRIWGGVIILLALVVGIGAWYYFFYEKGTNGNEQVTQNETTQPAIDPDSLQLDVTVPANRNNESLTENNETETLPDTLTLVIYAAYDKLEPVRVNTDVINSLNPYWIEQGEAFRFEFVNSMEFRGQYSRMALIFNGHLIENFRQEFFNPESGMIEINRSFFEDDPQWLQPAPDSLNVPQPITIRDRPSFN